MTTLAITDRVRAEALKLDPVRVVLFVVLLPFLVLGWSVRLVGYILAFAWIAAKAGYGDAGQWLEERERRKATG